MTDSSVRKLIARAGARVRLPAAPLQRHGCGFKLANEGHDTRVIQHYPEHENFQRAVRYT